MKPESLYTLSERVSTELSPERPERVTLLVARTAEELLVEELLRVAWPELLLLTEPSEEELLLLTVEPEALLEERVLEALEPLELERVLLVVAALLLEERVLLEEPALLLEERVACWLLLPLEERVTCWLLLPEVLLVEEEPEVERLTCWLLEEVERDTVAAELERVAEDELDREAVEPELERVA